MSFGLSYRLSCSTLYPAPESRQGAASDKCFPALACILCTRWAAPLTAHRARGFPGMSHIVPDTSSPPDRRQNNKRAHSIHGTGLREDQYGSSAQITCKVFFWKSLFRGRTWKFASTRAESKRKYHNFSADENGFTVICKCGIINFTDESGVTICPIWQIMGLSDLCWIAVLASSQC